MSRSIVQSDLIVHKPLVASFIVVVSIATTFLLTQQFPAEARSKHRSKHRAKPINTCVDTSPVAQRVLLTLKADKKIRQGEQVVFEPIVGKSPVKPGDIIKYTVIAKNNSHCPLKNLMLKQLIPKGTIYIKNSATDSNGVELLFSVDRGKTFVAKPKVDNQEAPVTAYDYIRWKFPGKIATNAEVKTVYELQIK
ncbi:MAG: hypothetical protein RLZZ135_1788 [Cyanobacteriota bacterium]